MAKRALVAGIDDYSQWRTLSGMNFPQLQFCVADATAFANALTTAFGFSADDIVFCQDSEATLQGILAGLTNLVAGSEAGDVACFYFAGHGGRVPSNGWGTASEVYYDAIVPFDGAGMIFDAQVSSIAQASLAAGVNFTIVLDCGHAGGAANGGVASRSYVWPDAAAASFASSCGTIVPLAGLLDAGAIAGNVGKAVSVNGGVTVVADASKDFAGSARALLLSACNYGEGATENANSRHGNLTGALLDLASQPAVRMAPADLLTAVRRKVSDSTGGTQTPQLRGRPVVPSETFLNPLPAV